MARTSLIRALVIGGLALSALACSGPEPSETSTTGRGPSTSVSPTTSIDVATSTETPKPADPTSAPTDQGSAPLTTPTETDTPATTAKATATVAAPSEPAATREIDMSGALLPNHRILSFYGHPNSAAMGILGEQSIEETHQMLLEQAAAYEAADPSRPVIIAFELIATVAQPQPGPDGTYVAYTGDEIIQEYVNYATANNLLLILDLQIGHDSIVDQINLIRHWLILPNVHVALDPEFSMKANETVPRDRIPGEFIGEVNGLHVQQGMELLAEIAAEAAIPPKMLIVHQFEDEMIFNKEQITPISGVQFVLDMDGFGAAEAKTGNYRHFVRDQLIEFGGIKLFYRQDEPLLTPEEVTALDPAPVVVIYQ